MEKTITKLEKLKFSPQGTNLFKQLISTIILLVLLLYGYNQSFTEYRILVFLSILLTVIGGIWVLAKKQSSTPLKPFIILWLCSYLISVILSIDPRRSISQMYIMLAGLFLFLLSNDLINRGWKLKWLFRSFVVIGSFVAIFSLKDALSWYTSWLRVNPGDFFPNINYRPANANIISPYMYLTFHMALPLFFGTKKKVLRYVIAFIMILTMIELYITSSRGGWLGMFFGLIIWVVYFYIMNRATINTFIQKLVSNRWYFSVSVFMIIAIMVSGGFLLYKKALHPTHGSIFTSRSGLWGPAITAFKQNPIFGQGQFTYGTSFLLEHSSPPNNIYGHSHGLYHNLLAEMGIVGFFSAFIFGFAFLKQFKNNFFQSKEKIFLLAIFAYCVSFFIHNIFDSYHLEGSLFWPMTILTGAALANLSSTKTMHYSKRPWWVLVYIIFAWVGIWAVTPYYKAIELANQNQWQQAFEKFGQATKRDPGNALAHQQLAFTAAVLAQNGNKNMLNVAIHELETTIHYEPSWAYNHLNLSSLYLAKYDVQKAVYYSFNAIQLAPYSAHIKFNSNPTWDDFKVGKIYTVTKNISERFSNEDFRNDANLILLLKEYSQYSWAHNLQAKYFLEKNNLTLAKKSLLNAELAYKSNKTDSIETTWVWAEFYAKQGEYKKAIEKGNSALNSFNSFGIYGPGTFGDLQYAPRIFRMGAMRMEIVPQTMLLPIPDLWIKRIELLNKWKNLQM